MPVALANTSLFAPYQVSTWSDIPPAQKESSGLWYQDYGGFMAIGYSSKFGTITSLNDLLSPEFKGAVALNGNPTSAHAALNGVMMASIGRRRVGQQHRQRRQLLREAQEGGQLLAGPGDRRHDQGGHHPGRVQLGLPQSAEPRRRVGLEGVHPAERPPGWLLRAGHQQERTAPGRGPAVGGVPLLAGRLGRAEPLARRGRPAGGAGRDAGQWFHQQGRGGQAARGLRDSHVPQRVPVH